MLFIYFIANIWECVTATNLHYLKMEPWSQNYAEKEEILSLYLT